MPNPNYEAIDNLLAAALDGPQNLSAAVADYETHPSVTEVKPKSSLTQELQRLAFGGLSAQLKKAKS